MPFARPDVNTPNKNKDNEWEYVIVVEGTTDGVEAIGKAYTVAPSSVGGFPIKPGVELQWRARSIAEVTLTYGLSNDQKDDEPQGEQPTIGTLEISSAGRTQHTAQCISQQVYPVDKFNDLIQGQVVGWHRDGVNGVDIDIPGSVYSLTKKWLPTAITGTYLDGLDDMRGKTNEDTYVLQWGFQKKLYSITCQPGELRFVSHKAKTDFTPSGIGIWEITYEMLRTKNRTNVMIGKDKSGTMITAPTIKGHQYVWVVYEKKEIATPPATIEVPQAAFVSNMYETANFKTKLKF